MTPPKKPLSPETRPDLYRPEIVRAPREAVESLAYRRSATAVCWVMFDLPFESVSLLERLRVPKRVDSRQVAQHYAVSELAGWQAAQRHNPHESIWSEEGAREAERLLRAWSSSYAELAAMVQRFKIAGKKMLEDPVTWCKVEATAGELLMSVHVDRALIEEVIRVIDETIR